MDSDFKECATCAEKPGSPTLCPSCIHNMELIGRLKRELGQGRQAAWALGLDYGSYEGKRAPLTLFDDEVEALAAQKIMASNFGTSTYLIQAPFWPGVRDDN